ncbi:MAG: hypothetical protein R3Y63_15135, partial [Eubacteriales bacterium]
PVYEETAPVYEETAPVYEETAPVYEENPPVYEENPPVYEETTLVYEETAPVPQYVAEPDIAVDVLPETGLDPMRGEVAVPQPPEKPELQNPMAAADYSISPTETYAEYEDDGAEPFTHVEKTPVEYPEFGHKPVASAPLAQEEMAPVTAPPVVEAPAPVIVSEKGSSLTQTEVPSLDAAREAFLSRTIKKTDLPRADFSTIQFEEGFFIGGTQVEVVENLLLTLSKFTGVDYVFSEDSRALNICDNVLWGEEDIDRAVEEIRSHIWGHPVKNVVVLIPSYHKFCEIASQRSMDRLTRMLKKRDHKLVVMTGDSVDYLAPYQNWDLTQVAVRQNQGILTSPEAMDSLLPYFYPGLVPPTVEVQQGDFLYYYDKVWKILFV